MSHLLPSHTYCIPLQLPPSDMARGQCSGCKRSKFTVKDEVMVTSPATSSLRVLSHKWPASSEAGSPSSSLKRKMVSFTLCDPTISPVTSQSQGSPSNPLPRPLSSTEAKVPTLHIHKPQACPVTGPATIPKKSAKEIGDAAEKIVCVVEILPALFSLFVFFSMKITPNKLINTFRKFEKKATTMVWWEEMDTNRIQKSI